MRVLVTGSAGYIGPVVVRRLKAAGHEVLGYDTEWFGRDTESTWRVRGDIRDPLVHPDWPDVVVHLAGLSNDPMGELDPGLTRDINLEGTLLMLSRYRDARHVVISSCAVYGQCGGLATEDTTPNPQTMYARCKSWVDALTTYRVDRAVILRLGTVFGDSPNLRLDTVVNRMVFDALNGLGVTVTGNAARPLVHIEDVASAVQWAVEGYATGIYNVVGENVRMRDLGRAIAHFADVPVRYVDGGADTRDYMASGEKLLRAGWASTYTVEGSLPVMFEKFLRYDKSDLPDHIRLLQLRYLIDAGELDPKTLRFAA
jgi:nucleoside-diphosphate-sugar epimerase